MSLIDPNDALASTLEAILDSGEGLTPNADQIADSLRIDWAAGAIRAEDFAVDRPDPVHARDLKPGQYVVARRGYGVVAGFVQSVYLPPLLAFPGAAPMVMLADGVRSGLTLVSGTGWVFDVLREPNS